MLSCVEMDAAGSNNVPSTVPHDESVARRARLSSQGQASDAGHGDAAAPVIPASVGASVVGFVPKPPQGKKGTEKPKYLTRTLRLIDSTVHFTKAGDEPRAPSPVATGADAEAPAQVNMLDVVQRCTVSIQNQDKRLAQLRAKLKAKERERMRLVAQRRWDRLRTAGLASMAVGLMKKHLLHHTALVERQDPTMLEVVEHFRDFRRLVQLPPYARSDSDITTMANIIGAASFFRCYNFELDTRKEICRTVQLLTFRRPDSTVFSQGDAAKHYYVVLLGSLSVTITNSDTGEEQEVAALCQGNGFGELALVDDGPRWATVRTSAATQLLAVPKETWFKNMQQQQNVILEKKLGFLRTVACLKRMDARKLRKLAAVTTIVRFQVGEVIAVEDDNVEPLQWFMIVKMGEVQVEKRRDELSRRGRMRVVASGPGSRTIAAPPSRRTKLRPLPLCTICAGDVATPITALDHANVKEGARHIATLTARTVVLVAVVSKPDFIARLDPTDHAMIRPYLLSVPSLQETQRLGRERDRWRQYKSQLVRETVAEHKLRKYVASPRQRRMRGKVVPSSTEAPAADHRAAIQALRGLRKRDVASMSRSALDKVPQNLPRAPHMVRVTAEKMYDLFAGEVVGSAGLDIPLVASPPFRRVPVSRRHSMSAPHRPLPYIRSHTESDAKFMSPIVPYSPGVGPITDSDDVGSVHSLRRGSLGGFPSRDVRVEGTALSGVVPTMQENPTAASTQPVHGSAAIEPLLGEFAEGDAKSTPSDTARELPRASDLSLTAETESTSTPQRRASAPTTFTVPTSRRPSLHLPAQFPAGASRHAQKPSSRLRVTPRMWRASEPVFRADGMYDRAIKELDKRKHVAPATAGAVPSRRAMQDLTRLVQASYRRRLEFHGSSGTTQAASPSRETHEHFHDSDNTGAELDILYGRAPRPHVIPAEIPRKHAKPVAVAPAFTFLSGTRQGVGENRHASVDAGFMMLQEQGKLRAIQVMKRESRQAAREAARVQLQRRSSTPWRLINPPNPWLAV